MQLIKQDANLYRVDSKLYRSEQLNRDDLATIRQLGIRSVVNLRYFGRHKNQKIFAGHPDIALINRPLLTWRVQPRDIARALATTAFGGIWSGCLPKRTWRRLRRSWRGCAGASKA